MPNHLQWKLMPGKSLGTWCGAWPWRLGTFLLFINPSAKKNWPIFGLNGMPKIIAV